MTAAPTHIAADEHVFLIGRPPLGEYIGFLKTQTVEGQTADDAALAEQWRAANARIQQLEMTEAGAADDPLDHELPSSLGILGPKVLEDPIVRRSFGITRNEIRMVALDRLVVFQKQINLGYAFELEQALGNEPTDQDLFNFCLPIDRRYDPPTRVAPIAHGPKGPAAWAMLSPSTDFRVLETTLLDPSQVIGLDMTGAPTQVVAVVVGYGSNFVTAVRAGSRLILRNGSHRAYALRAAGRTHAPVLIQNIAHQEELGLLLPEIESHPDLYLTYPRPPLLRDYFDNDLRLLVHVPRKTRQVRIAVNFEESYSPGI
jgi:hypothetical protein